MRLITLNSSAASIGIAQTSKFQTLARVWYEAAPETAFLNLANYISKQQSDKSIAYRRITLNSSYLPLGREV